MNPYRDIDDIIKDVMEEMKGQPPAANEMWQRINRRLQVEEARRKLKFKKFAAVAGLLIILGIGIFTVEPERTSAIGNFVSRVFRLDGRGPVKNVLFSYSREPDEAGPAVKEIATITPVTTTLEEARKKATFKILIPAYLPPGFSLKEVTWEKIRNPSYRVTLNYQGPQGGFLSISQQNLLGEMGAGYMYDSEDTLVEEVIIQGSPATLTISKNKLARIFWLNQNVSFELFGQISKNEILKVVKSLK